MKPAPELYREDVQQQEEPVSCLQTKNAISISKLRNNTNQKSNVTFLVVVCQAPWAQPRFYHHHEQTQESTQPVKQFKW